MKEPPDDNGKQLLDLLVRATSSGVLDAETALPVVTKLLLAGSTDSDSLKPGLADVLGGLLEKEDGDEFVELWNWLRKRRLAEALKFHDAQRSGGGSEAAKKRFQFFLGDLPDEIRPAWKLRPTDPGLEKVNRGVEATAALAFLKREDLVDEVPDLAQKLKGEMAEASLAMRDEGLEAALISARLLKSLEGCSVEVKERLLGFEKKQIERIEASLVDESFPDDVREELLLAAVEKRIEGGELDWSERRALVIAACQWKSPALEPVVASLIAKDARLGEVGALMLRMRFGREVAGAQPPGVWFSDQRKRYKPLGGYGADAAALVQLWLASDRELDAAEADELELMVAREGGLDRNAVAQRWADLTSDEEWERLTGVSRQPVVVPPDPPAEKVAQKKKEEKPSGRLPALWAEHVQPFVVENWYMVAGIFMTIVGASLLAFYTWDRHWLIRYTLMPGMLALFTAGLARAGTWIAGKGADFFGTAAMLRSAAIGLLPVNFMAVALLAKDDAVSQKLLAIGVMGLIYVVLAGWGLWRWCRAEHPQLGVPMAGTLLMLNSLVALGPMAMVIDGGSAHHLVVGAGFYLGFGLLAAAIIWFGSRCLDVRLLKQRRVPWFFFVGLVGTLVQVFLWVHSQAGRWPQVHTYAPLLVMGGGLALFFDLRAGYLMGEKGDREKLGAVTSFGFGMVMLGVVMAMADDYFRILALLLAGFVWLGQAVWRGRMAVVHFWVGLTFVALSVASVGLLEAFPKGWLPALSVGFALACFGLEPAARGLRKEFGEALRGMHFASLVIAVVVAVMVQWHLKSPPLLTAAWLGLIAAMFGIGARREKSVRWVHVAMVILAMAIPYLGFAKMQGHDWRGNTVVFGLAILSFAWIWMSSATARFPTAARGRSTVLWFYGLLAVVAMVIRIYFEGARHAGIGGLAKFMDLGGPLLMAAALMAASYFSRSLVAGGMAAIILVILFPELKATFEEVLPANLWGSGIGSSLTALGLISLSFWLRKAAFLKELAPGDRFLDRYEFPLRRCDHTLATWPVVASACFLTAKIVLRNVPIYLSGLGLDVLFGVALVLCALVSGLLAVYFRKIATAPTVLVNVGLALLAVAVHALFDRLALQADQAWRWLVFLIVALVLYVAARLANRRWEWMARTLEKPVFWGLAYWALFIGWEMVWKMSVFTAPSLAMWSLVLLLVGVLAWQELEIEKVVHGAALFLVLGLALIAQSNDALHVGVWLPLAILVIATGLEFFPKEEQRWRPLTRVEVWSATLVIVLVGLIKLYGIGGAFGWPVVLALGLAARAHRSTPIAVLAICVGFTYGLQRFELEFGRVTGFGWLALLLAVALPLGWRLLERYPRLLTGLRPQRPFSVTSSWVVVCASSVCAALSVLNYEALRAGEAVPVLALLALVVLGWSLRSEIFGWCALLVSVQVNARFAESRCDFCGGWLILAIGLSASLLMLMAVRDLRRVDRLKAFAAEGGALLGGGILLSLLIHFSGSGGMPNASWSILLVCGAMAFIAARGLRAEKKLVPIYHAALVIMAWCLVFAIPGMRGLGLVLLGGFVPALYFWWRVERGGGKKYRDTALLLSLMTVLVWIFRDLFALAVYRQLTLGDEWYQFGAPVLFLAGAMALRLRCSEGVLAMIVGSFFYVTAIPGLSPFTEKIAAAWVAIGLGHLWVAAMTWRAPLKDWLASRSGVGGLLVAVHLAILNAATSDAGAALALLMLGGASVLFHMAFLRGNYWLHWLAVAEMLVAVHCDLIGMPQVVWILLGLWVVNLFFYDAVIKRVAPGGGNFIPVALGVLVMFHVVGILGGESWEGLLAVALAGVLAALTRVSERVRPWSLLLLAVPVWLTFFSLSGLVVSLCAAGAVALAIAWWARGGVTERPGSRLFHQMLGSISEIGDKLAAAVNLAVLFIAVCVHWMQQQRVVAFGSFELVLLLGIYTALAISFGLHRHFMPRLGANLIVQLCAVLIFQALRFQLVMTTGIWQPVYDVWATILASFLLLGVREMRGVADDFQSRASLAISLCLMPLAGLAVVASRDLGANAALLVVGVQSMVFAYLGRGRRESPYNIVAIFGFVAFVMMVFWTKLEFKVAHAYVVPAGLGVLALVQLFHRMISPATRNGVRLFTLVAMLGSTGYSALLDDSFPVVFHLTMLALCLACMGLGSLLRVRLYLYLGFAGLVVNLASILHKVLGAMERGSRMTTIGSLVLLGGILVLGAAIYYKTHRGAMDALIGRLRGRLAAWE